MYPQAELDIGKLKANLEAVSVITKDRGGCSLAIVTKGVCADREVVRVVAESTRVDFLADSRIKNIASYAQLARENGKQTMLLRIPMMCELDGVVKYVDICMNSELATIRALDESAREAEKIQKIVLMIDMGDLREGMFFADKELIFDAVREILSMENIELYGIGVNLTCYGAIIPKNDNLFGLSALGRSIEDRFGIKLNMISGGNSSSIYLIDKGEMPEGINNLRLGEAFLLGNDTAYGAKLPGTTDDAVILKAQVVELKEKPSLPIGEVGKDAFGQVPHYEDRGIMKRAIIAIGKQDTDIDSMEPLDPDVEIMGGSSDHIILDVTHSRENYEVGSVVSFKLGYGGMLKVMTSPYVVKTYKRTGRN